MAIEGDMEGGRWELVGVNGRLAGAFRKGLAEGFSNRPNALLSGRLTMWHANGTKSGEAEFSGGIPEGKFRGWHENGQLAVEGQIGLCQLVTATLWDNRGRRRFMTSEDSWTSYDESGAQTSYTIDEVFEIMGRNAFFFWLMSGARDCSGS
jgi:antitoxin component YwqK of YwqJK toxin-antitoxin module